MRKGGEPKYAHLSMELHVFIEVFAPVPEAYVRMAHAMEEIKKFLFPVSTQKSAPDSRKTALRSLQSSADIVFCLSFLFIVL